MKNKKLTMVIMIFLVALFFGLTYFFNIYKQVTPVVKNNCPYASDEDVYDQMIATGDAGVCACMQNSELKIACIDIAGDVGFYKKAINNLNAELCDNIKDVAFKDSCILTVQDGINNIPTDPGLAPEKKQI